MGEAVAVADDELVEGVARVERAVDEGCREQLRERWRGAATAARCCDAAARAVTVPAQRSRGCDRNASRPRHRSRVGRSGSEPAVLRALRPRGARARCRTSSRRRPPRGPAGSSAPRAARARGSHAAPSDSFSGASVGTFREGRARPARRRRIYQSDQGRPAPSRRRCRNARKKARERGRRWPQHRTVARRCVYWSATRPTRCDPMKRTYQPKKRKRARTHGFRARMQHPRRAAYVEAAAREGPQAPHGLMVGPAARGRPRGSRRGCLAAPTSTASFARGARTPAAISCCTLFHARRRGPSGSACRSRGRSAGRSSATASSGCCARRSRARARAAGRDRRGRGGAARLASALAEREGLAALRAGAAESLIDEADVTRERRALQDRRRMERLGLSRTVRERDPDPASGLPARCSSPLLGDRCKYYPCVL